MPILNENIYNHKVGTAHLNPKLFYYKILLKITSVDIINISPTEMIFVQLIIQTVLSVSPLYKYIN